MLAKWTKLAYFIVLPSISELIACPKEEDPISGQVLAIHNHPYIRLSPETFDGVRVALPTLAVLILQNDSIVKIDEHTFGSLESLKCLDLSFNELTKLTASMFAGLKHLKTLTLANNAISCIQKDTFEGLSALEILDLSHNELVQLLDGQFQLAKNLRALHLENNLLEGTISDTVWTGLNNLEYLHVNNNPILDLPLATSLPALKRLVAHSSQIKRLPPLNEISTRLTVLNLANGNISTLGTKQIAFLSELAEIMLAENPFQCDCHLIAFAKWLVNTSNVIDKSQIKCQYPQALQGVNVVSILFSNLSNLYENCTENDQWDGTIRFASNEIPVTPLNLAMTENVEIKKVRDENKALHPPIELTSQKPGLENSATQHINVVEQWRLAVTWKGALVWAAIGLCIGISCFSVYKIYKCVESGTTNTCCISKHHSSSVRPISPVPSVQSRHKEMYRAAQDQSQDLESSDSRDANSSPPGAVGNIVHPLTSAVLARYSAADSAKEVMQSKSGRFVPPEVPPIQLHDSDSVSSDLIY